MPENGENPKPWEQKVLEKTLSAAVIEQRRSRRWGIFFKLFFVSYLVFLTVVWFQGKPTKAALKEHVALIDLVGTIGQGKQIEADQIASSLRNAFNESRAKAVILRINSPGGTPVQSAYIYDEIMRLKKLHPNKKVYTVVVDMCASGAYWVACAADSIYANGSSVVGSIGVLMPSYGFVETMKKVGAEQRSLASGKNKLFLDPLSPVNPQQVDFAKALLDNMHQQFIDAVKAGRGDRLKITDETFTGLIWTGEQSLKLGLIDGLGSAGFVAREVIGIEEVIDYSPSSNLLDKLASRFGASFSNQLSADLGLSNQAFR